MTKRRVVIIDNRKIGKIAQLCVEGMTTDGGHHKQWFLEQILYELGYNPLDIHEKFGTERGIAS